MSPNIMLAPRRAIVAHWATCFNLKMGRFMNAFIPLVKRTLYFDCSLRSTLFEGQGFAFESNEDQLTILSILILCLSTRQHDMLLDLRTRTYYYSKLLSLIILDKFIFLQ